MFAEPFMQRAFVEMALLSLLCGLVGTVVLIRRHAFVTDALSHTVFPGVAVGYAAGNHLFLGALVAAVISAVLLAVLTRVRRADDDSVLALLISSFFAFGIIVVSRRPSFQSDLGTFLFGSVLTVDRNVIVQTAAITVIVIVVLVAAGKELYLRAFDVEAASAMGYKVPVLDSILNSLVALVVVSAAQAVGTALVVPLLIVPAATSRLVSDRVGRIAVLSIVLTAVGAAAGLAVSYSASVRHSLRVEAGAAITSILVVVFAITAFATTMARRRRPV